MRVEYSITGTLVLPEGSHFSEKQSNLVILPDGKTLSVHPVIELATGTDTDDHRNINYKEAKELGVEWEDYDRSLEEALDDPD